MVFLAKHVASVISLCTFLVKTESVLSSRTSLQVKFRFEEFHFTRNDAVFCTYCLLSLKIVNQIGDGDYATHEKCYLNVNALQIKSFLQYTCVFPCLCTNQRGFQWSC